MRIRRILFAQKSKVVLQEQDWEPRLEPRQILIQSSCSMVSPGTELAALTGTHSRSQLPEPPAWLAYPSVPGYLVCGTVVEKGSEVDNLRIGDRVVGEGAGVWNSHVSHLVMESNDWKVVPVAENVSFEEAVFTKLGSIAMVAPRVLHPQFGDTVAVMGLGLVGQLAAQLCRLAGAGRVVAVDPLERRRAVARRPGIAAVAPDPEDSLIASAGAQTDRLAGFDHVIEASGHPAAFLQACRIARIRGKIAVLSSPHKAMEIRLYDHIHAKGLQVLGAHGFVLPLVPDVNDTWNDARQRRLFMQLLAEERVDVRSLVTHTVSADQAPAMYRGLRERPEDHLGVIFRWNES